MVTVYFYTEGTDAKEVIKATGLSIDVAERRAKTYARKLNKSLAGGYFTAKGKPSKWKMDHIKVIEIPKGIRAERPPSMGSTVNKDNLVNYIIAYEDGNMTVGQFLKLFGYLIKTGTVWSLQGSYGRQARRLIDSGFIDKSGKVNWTVVDDAGIDRKAMLYEG